MSLKVIVGFIAVSVGLLLAMTLLLSSTSNANTSQATETSAIATVSSYSSDFGAMKVSDVRSAEFTIKNMGQEALQISNMSSSCGCTKGQFIYKGKTSSEFGMHAESGYLGAIAPGEEAQVKVTYRPAEMPVYGPVERTVSVETNDPNQPKLTFKVTARVE